MQAHTTHPDSLLALDLPGFAARDTENLTGVHRETCRDWRRRGFIPSGPPPTNRRHIGDLTRLYLMRVLANVQGSSPAAAAPLARAFLPSVLARILDDPRAVTPDSLEPPEGRVAFVLRMLTLPTPPEGRLRPRSRGQARLHRSCRGRYRASRRAWLRRRSHRRRF